MLMTRMFRSSRRLARHEGGMAATEFALILPVMLALYLRVTELSDGLIANTKVSSIAATATDLASQNDKLCNSEMADIFAALNAIIFPYPTTNTKVVISSLIDAGSNQVKVAWSDALNGTPRTVNSVVAIPTGLVTSGGGGSVILTEVTYYYHSPAGELIYGTVTMTDKFYGHPRRVAKITRTTSTCT